MSPELSLMKQFNLIAAYLLYVISPIKKFKGELQKNDISNPHYLMVGINFANNLAGNLYPAEGSSIKYLRLRQKDVASHLYCVNQHH